MVTQATDVSNEQKTILIVDDEPKICRLHASFFSRMGFRAMTATSGHEALKVLETTKPAFLLLDIRMPDLSGLEVLKRAKAKDPGLRVVVVSAMPDEETVAEAKRLGAEDYVTKPLAYDDWSWANAFFESPDWI